MADGWDDEEDEEDWGSLEESKPQTAKPKSSGTSGRGGIPDWPVLVPQMRVLFLSSRSVCRQVTPLA
jgi:hypothetical protein